MLAQAVSSATPPQDFTAEFGKPWLAVEEVFETFVVYCVSRAFGPAPFVSETLDDLAVLIRADAPRKPTHGLFWLICSSHAVEPFIDEAFFELLRRAHAKNEASGVIGVLIAMAASRNSQKARKPSCAPSRS